jgi:hypothetical protein
MTENANVLATDRGRSKFSYTLPQDLDDLEKS